MKTDKVKHYSNSYGHCPKHCNYCYDPFAECCCTKTKGGLLENVKTYDLSGKPVYGIRTDNVIG